MRLESRIVENRPTLEKPEEAALSVRPYGTLADGSAVEAWTLRGRGGMVLEVLTYGGAVRRLELPGPGGVRTDVVLGFDDLADWESSNQSYFGVIAGRVAGRIPGGLLRVGDECFQLPCNEGANHLHGGGRGLDKRVWSAEPAVADGGSVALRLRYLSPAGEEGYPGAVELSATYTVTPDNRMIFETEAVSDRVTPVSLAQHSYFNLAGEGSVADHELQVFASRRMTTDENLTPLGVDEPVEGQAADLRRPRRLGEVIPELWKCHGDLYWLDSDEPLKPAARVVHPPSGRTLEVSTSHDFVQFYAAAHLDGSLRGKGGRGYVRNAGLCLECQGYPDPGAGFGEILVRPGEPQRHRTIYAFGFDDG